MTTVIISGAGAGIGRATAVEFGRIGRHVVRCDRDPESAAETCALVTVAGGSAIAEIIDLRNAAATIGMVGRIAGTHDLTAIIHSAALFPRLSFAATTLDDVNAVMAVNFRAAIALARAGVSAMPKGGSLVFLTSGAGLPDRAAVSFQRPFALYGASKAALDRWVLGVAAELAEAGIAASTLTPGAVVETPGVAAVRDDSFTGMPTIDAYAVGGALAWLAAEPRLDLAGHRLNAVEFGIKWGPGIRPASRHRQTGSAPS